MKKITILLSACNAQFIPDVSRSLKENGEREIRLLGVDMNIDSSLKLFFDNFFKVPAVTDPYYYDTLIKICKENNVDIYIPFMSAELEELYNRRNDFLEIGTILSLPPIEAIKICNDKLNFYRFLNENNIQNIKFYEAKTFDEFESAALKIGYPNKPFCVKIPNGSGSRGVRIIDNSKSAFDIFMTQKPNSLFVNYKHMLDILREAPVFPKLIVTEYLPGDEYTVDVLAENGKILAAVGRINSSIFASIPNSCVYHEDAKAINVCEKVVRYFNYTGNACFDFRLNEKGEAILMEVNPRISATISFSSHTGINLIYLRVKQLLNEAINITKPRKIKMNRKFLDIYTELE